jgi:hypothetical protein
MTSATEDMLSLFTKDRYARTPALVNDKRWTQEQTYELLDLVRNSEVRTAPATHRHQLWAMLGKKLSTPRTSKEACSKYHQVCSHLKPVPVSSQSIDAVIKSTPANMNGGVGTAPAAAAAAAGSEASAAEAVAALSSSIVLVPEGDVLDQAIADNIDDSKPRRLAFASPAPVAGLPSQHTSTSNTSSSSSTPSSSSSSSTSAVQKKLKEVPIIQKAKPTSVRGVSVGDTVMVDSRTWPGVNKPGGAGRVTSINVNCTFNIKYLLGGSERSVDADYVHVRNLTANAGERKRGRRTFYDPINNEAVVPDDDGIVRSKQQEEEEAREREAKEAKEVAAKEATKVAALAHAQKEAAEQKQREKSAALRKSRAAAKRSRKKANAAKVVEPVISETAPKKKRKRSNDGGESSKRQRSRARSHSTAAPSLTAEEQEDLQSQNGPASSAMSLRAREMEQYAAPTIHWPLPPLWMDDTFGNRPTLFQAAQFIATKETRRDERAGWLAQIITRQ